MCGCACLFALIAAGAPRLALIFVWISTNLVDRAFDGFILPLLGLLFLPWTTLFYVLVFNPESGISLLGWLLVILAILFDLGSYMGSGYGNRNRFLG